MAEGKVEPVELLSYREVQAELKALGLPAKGKDEVLRARLAEAREQADVEPEPETLAPEEVALTASPPPRKTRRQKEHHVHKVKLSPEAAEAVRSGETELFLQSDEEPLPAAKASPAKASPAKASPRPAAKGSPSPRAPRARRVSVNTTPQVPETPLERAKRVARKSAADLQQSLAGLHREVQRRRLSWLWPLLAALLLALLLGSQWRHRGHWQSAAHSQLDNLRQGSSALAGAAQEQAAALGRGLQRSYSTASDSVSDGLAWLSDSAQKAGEWAAEAGEGALEAAKPYLPRLKVKQPEQNLGPRSGGCAARLNAEQLGPVFPDGAAWAGLRGALREVWAGQKDDALKGTGVLLAGGSRAGLRTAAAAIERAVPPECRPCYLHLRGDEELAAGGENAAGQLQQRLAQHLAACPQAVVHIEAVNSVHADALPVLLAAMSEQGSLTQDGRQLPSHEALYIGSTLVALHALEEADEQRFADAVKRDLVQQLLATASPQQAATPAAFRRRWDIVAPIRQHSRRP